MFRSAVEATNIFALLQIFMVVFFPGHIRVIVSEKVMLHHPWISYSSPTQTRTHACACWMITSCVKFSRSGFRTAVRDTKSSHPRAASPRALHCPGCPHLCQTTSPTRPSARWTNRISWPCADTWTVSVRRVCPHYLHQQIWPPLDIICPNAAINTLYSSKSELGHTVWFDAKILNKNWKTILNLPYICI